MKSHDTSLTELGQITGLPTATKTARHVLRSGSVCPAHVPEVRLRQQAVPLLGVVSDLVNLDPVESITTWDDITGHYTDIFARAVKELDNDRVMSEGLRFAKQEAHTPGVAGRSEVTRGLLTKFAYYRDRPESKVYERVRDKVRKRTGPLVGEGVHEGAATTVAYQEVVAQVVGRECDLSGRPERYAELIGASSGFIYELAGFGKIMNETAIGMTRLDSAGYDGRSNNYVGLRFDPDAFCIKALKNRDVVTFNEEAVTAIMDEYGKKRDDQMYFLGCPSQSIVELYGRIHEQALFSGLPQQTWA